ncbi:MAG: hypothetical protein GY797_04635 [Deltaproteobacteria bacterium]|nr:hypothetical protein [Deltaproteobacteria bacterium]
MINRKTGEVCVLVIFLFTVLYPFNLFATEYQIINISGAGGVKFSDIIKDSRYLYEKTKIPVEVIFPSGERMIPKVFKYSDKDFNNLRKRMQGLIASKPDVHYIFVVNSQGWVPFSKLALELKALGIKDKNYDVILNQPAGKMATGFIPNKFPHQTFSFDKLPSQPRFVVNLMAPDIATRDRFDEPNIEYKRNYIDVRYGPITDIKKGRIITNEIDKHSKAVGSGLTHEIPQVIKILSNRSLVSNKNTFEELFSNIKVELSMGKKLRENYRDQALRKSVIIPHSKQTIVPNVAGHLLVSKITADNLFTTVSSLKTALSHIDKDDKKMIVGNAKALEGFSKALWKDIDMAGEGGFALAKSYSLEQIGKYGLKKMPDVVKHLKKTGKISESFKIPPDMSFTADIFSAIGKDIKSTGTNKFVLIKSHTLEQIGRTGLEKLPDIVRYLKDTGKISKSVKIPPKLSWAGDLISAIGKDIESTGTSRFVLLKSQTLEEIGKIGIKKMPEVVTALKMKGKLPSSFKVPATFGAEDFAVAIGRNIGSGRADVDTITYYLDGANKAAWGAVGYRIGGAKSAQMFQSIADSVAKAAREVTQPLFNMAVRVSSGQGKKIVDDWQTLQQRRIHHGLNVQSIKDIYGEKLLIENGFSRKMIQELDAEVHNLNKMSVNMKQDFGVQKIDTFSKTGEANVGGVWISPELTYAGKGGADVKKKVIESHQSEEDLSWDFELPEGVEW